MYLDRFLSFPGYKFNEHPDDERRLLIVEEFKTLELLNTRDGGATQTRDFFKSTSKMTCLLDLYMWETGSPAEFQVGFVQTFKTLLCEYPDVPVQLPERVLEQLAPPTKWFKKSSWKPTIAAVLLECEKLVLAAKRKAPGKNKDKAPFFSVLCKKHL